MPTPTSASTIANATALFETWPGIHVPLLNLWTTAIMTENGTRINDHPQRDKSYSRPHGQARGMHWHMRLVTLHLAQE